MTLFYYKGKNLSGEVVEGVHEAQNELDAVSMLRQKGFYPVKIRKRSYTFYNIVRIIRRSFNKIEQRELAVFCRQFVVLLRAGITIIESLEILDKQSVNKYLKYAVGNVIKDIKKGMTLTDAFKNNPEVFSDVFVSMIEAGELAGNLISVLDKLALHYEKCAIKSGKIKNALTYPAILGMVSLIVAIFLVVNIIPVFEGIFSKAGVELPFATRFLLIISQHNISLIVLFSVLIVPIILLIYSITAKGAYFIDEVRLKIPIWGRIKVKALSADLCRLLSILVSSGVPLLDSLRIASRTLNNRVFQKELALIQKALADGKGFAEVMNPDVFPSMMIKMIAVGEETGNLELTLDKSADFFENEVELMEERLIALIEPVLIIIMSLIVGFIVLAVVLPMSSIYNFY
ncbi:MAG: type II secretion system F family protein [Tepidanaerobacteraceae bacterium]